MKSAERSLNKTERLFALVLLLQNRPSLTSRDLAAHFGVSRRTIFRDLRTLSESGVPITYGDEGGYEILEGYQLPPLMFTAREAATVLVGAAFTRLQPDLSLRADAEAVAMKIRSVLPENVREYIDRLQERTVVGPYLRDASPVTDHDDQGHWYTLSEAVAVQRSVWMEYFVASRAEMTKRKVDPLALVYFSEAWNLIAYDHLRRSIRNFRLDGIRKMRLLMDLFERPVGFDLPTYLREKGSTPDTRRIALRFSRRAFERARRTIPAEIIDEYEEEGAVVVSFLFENLEYLADWLLHYGTEVHVDEPAELRQRLGERAEALARHYA
jgi:predicted DNA-binding transcriptional regulator YafY